MRKSSELTKDNTAPESVVIHNKLLFLQAAYLSVLCLTVCFANYFIKVFGMTLPGGIFVFPVSFIICDVVVEVYGYTTAKMFVWLGIIVEVFFAFTSQWITALPNPDVFIHAQAYNTVFEPTVRYVFSGMAGFFCGEFMNAYLLSTTKIWLQGKHFIVRSVCTTALGQGLLSIVVDYLAFSGKMSNTALVKMVFSGWKIKMAYSLLFVVPAWFIVRYIKKKDNIDVYDTNVNYNPFWF
ncbi:queuosine precursor transporter [Shewanella sp. 202IG2-18]|uniref:queuosine precursor transporter n=1 Tax=Parashewanella hymeniacidonis TaxID=2807618 RepID=UPI0019622718|nr:queuosine precursor transporter [Parashewanella hymeniacidonis]MBM7074716.1 queuosine precursor transporter [Parashewanella hymeniacidonis]